MLEEQLISKRGQLVTVVRPFFGSRKLNHFVRVLMLLKNLMEICFIFPQINLL